MLTDIAALLTTPPGNLAYHFSLAVSLAVLLALAQVYASGGTARAATRWTVVSAGLLVPRLILAGVEGWTTLGGSDDGFLLPSADRYLALAGACVFAWAVLFPAQRRRSGLALVLALTLGLIGMAVSAASQAAADGLSFNETWADTLWMAAVLAVCLAAFAVLMLRRRGQWAIAAGAFLLLALGAGVHLWTQLWTGPAGAYAGLLRLGELAAYPLFLIAAARGLAAERPRPAPAAVPAPTPREMRTLRALRLSDSLGGVLPLLSAPTTREFAPEMVRAVASALRCEFCLLLTPPDPDGHLVVAAGYDLIREAALPGASLDSAQAPIISAALTQRRTFSLPARSQSPDTRALRAALGLDFAGPILLIPLIDGDELIGGLLLLSPYARQDWSADDQASAESLAAHLAARLGELRRRERAAEAGGDLHGRLEALTRENDRLTAELQRYAAEPGQAGNLAALLTINEEAQRTIHTLETEIDRLQGELGAARQTPAEEPAQDEIARMSEEMRVLLAALEQARSDLAVAQARGGTLDRFARTQPSPDFETIAAIARELHPPMSSVLDFTAVLLSDSAGELRPAQRKVVERLRSSVERMGTLVNDLVQVSAEKAGALGVLRTQVDLVHCIEEAVMRAGSALRAKSQTLRMDFADELPPILAEADSVIQVLHRLIDNAIHASPSGGEVALRARIQPQDGPEERSFALVSVTDSGVGIPPEDIGQVFQHFGLDEQGEVEGVGEIGPGLSVVKALCEGLGGRVWVDTVRGSGSTFTVLLPLAGSGQPSARPVPAG